ncbi:MAG: PAS domain S-box protein [Bacteroidota bacterium]
MASDLSTAQQIRHLEAENARLRAELQTRPRVSRQDAAPARVSELEARLRDRERDLRSILNHMPAMIGYWDCDLRNLFGNHAYFDWFGHDPAGMPGKHIREVIGEERYRLNLPYMEAALRGEAQTFERAIPTPDGKRVRHSLANYIPDMVAGEVRGFYALVTDITPLKEVQSALRASEECLRASEERFRAIVEDQTEVISRIRQDGTLIFVNNVYCRFFGRTAEEIIGSRWMPACHPDDLCRVEQLLLSLSPAQPVVVIENRVYAGNGAEHWMQFVNRAFFDDAGNLLEIQSVGRDITACKQAEFELQSVLVGLEQRVAERTEDIRRLTVEAVLAEGRERQAIARDLHDDLGQLLHVAKIRLDTLLKANATNEQRALTLQVDDMLSKASQRLRSLTAQLSPPVLESLGLIPALSWLGENIEQTYHLAVEVEDDGEFKPLSMAQSLILFRAARELLINVFKHANSPLASLQTWRDGNCFVLRVSDAGVGIDDVAAALSGSGGFGMASLRERISYLNGEMTIETNPGNGTAISLRLPLARAGGGQSA